MDSIYQYGGLALNAFSNVHQGYYWSSTNVAFDPNGSSALAINSVYGGWTAVGKNITNSYQGTLWPVRSSNYSSYTLPKTGQTSIYSAGDDGSLQKGIVWPIPRFTNPDGSAPVSSDVVVDRLTGLMWTKKANLFGAVSTWQDALNNILTP